MVEQSGEPFLLPFPCCLAHTAQSLGHAFPALCRGHVGLSDVLLGLRAFPPRPPPKVAPLCSAGSSVLRRSPTPPRRSRPPFGLWPSRTGLDLVDQDAPGGLPVLVHVVSQRARVLRLRRTDQPLAISAACRCCLPPLAERSRHPDPSAFRSSIARPTDTSVYASADTSRCHPQDSRPGWIRCSPFL